MFCKMFTKLPIRGMYALARLPNMPIYSFCSSQQTQLQQ